MAGARGQLHADRRRVTAFNRLRLTAQVSELALKIEFSIYVMNSPLVERPEQPGIVEGDAARDRRRALQSLKVGPAEFVDHNPEIDPVDFEPLQDDFAAQAE